MSNANLSLLAPRLNPEPVPASLDYFEQATAQSSTHYSTDLDLAHSSGLESEAEESEGSEIETPSLHELEAQLVLARNHLPPNWTLIENLRKEIEDLTGSSSKSLAKPSLRLTARQKVVYKRGYPFIY
ncbi:hypothetical protein JCM5350_002828 [Sporobolomyces pararoseus]